MGGRAGRPLWSADEIAKASTNAGGRQHIHQRTEEYCHHRGGSNCCYSRTTNTGYDACRAVYHRTTQLARGAVDEFLLFCAGRED